LQDLVRPGRFLLIFGEEGQDWAIAASAIAAANDVALGAVRIGHSDGDLFDTRLAWARHRGISDKGAVLVRPDRVVAWQSSGAVNDPAATLASALTIWVAPCALRADKQLQITPRQ
jgi:2,4-dichlorophenol 6-monooxygenase